MNWAAYHQGYIKGWDGHEYYVVQGDEIGELMDFHDDYLIWYRGITRWFISTSELHALWCAIVLVSHFSLSFI